MTVDDAITVLCVHTGGDLSSTQRLADAGPTIQPRSVRDTEAALDELERGAYDCLVLEQTVQEDCVEALERITGAHPDVPVLCYGVSDEVGPYLDAGATDIVPADAGPHRSRLLVTRIRNAVEQFWAGGRLQQRDQQLNSLLEHSSDPISVLDETGRYQFASPAIERAIGHDPEELLGTSAFEYVHPEDRAHVQELFERIRENPDETHSTEYRLRDTDGNWRWLESRGSNHLSDPTIEGIVVNSREITERKAREQALREEQALTEAIFDALPDVFYAFDENINFLRWNDRLSEVTGYTDEEIPSMHPAEFVLDEDRPIIFDAIARVVEHDETVSVEARFETKDGEVIPYEFTGAKMTDGDDDTLGIVGIGRDISDRKERQRRFEAVFNNTYQFTGLMEPDGTLVEVNETAIEFGGLDRSDVVGKPIWEAYWFQHSESARETARTAVEQAREGSLFRSEVVVQGLEGPETIDFSVRPLTDEHGAVRLLIPEGRTITALKQRERHLGILHRFLRHNLRNKMTVIQGHASLLAQALADTEHIDAVRQVQAAAEELVELSETANELSRVVTETDAALQPVDIEQLLQRVCADLREQYPSASVTVSGETARQVNADWRLRAVFEQLVENAIEHTSDEQPAVDVTVTADEDTVSVRVADDGPGIPEDELVGIFSEGEQTQLRHGTGFGLWLVRMVVDDYGGDLSYESPPDGGSVVVVTLGHEPDHGAVPERTDTAEHL